MAFSDKYVLVQVDGGTVGEGEVEVLVQFGKCKALFFILLPLTWIPYVVETY